MHCDRTFVSSTPSPNARRMCHDVATRQGRSAASSERLGSRRREPLDARRLERPPPAARAGRRGLGRACGRRAPRCRSAPSGSAAALGRGGRRLRRRRAPRRRCRCSRVHDPELLDYLRARLGASGRPRASTDDPGQDRVVPYLFPHPGLIAGLDARRRRPRSRARAGQFAYDTMTLIGPGTWEAARGGGRRGADRGRPRARRRSPPPTPAAGRPATTRPGRALRRLLLPQQRGRSPPPGCASASARPVAVIDIDAHHGNGTQAIFYDDPEVLVGSVHVDPGAGLVPALPRLRRRDRRRRRRGREPQPAAGARLRATSRGSRRSPSWPTGRATAAPAALVVALGVDAAAGDPESPLAVTAEGYRAAGRTLGALGLPTVVVQEGGYDLETIGALVPRRSPGSRASAETARGCTRRSTRLKLTRPAGRRSSPASRWPSSPDRPRSPGRRALAARSTPRHRRRRPRSRPTSARTGAPSRRPRAITATTSRGTGCSGSPPR